VTSGTRRSILLLTRGICKRANASCPCHCWRSAPCSRPSRLRNRGRQSGPDAAGTVAGLPAGPALRCGRDDGDAWPSGGDSRRDGVGHPRRAPVFAYRVGRLLPSMYPEARSTRATWTTSSVARGRRPCSSYWKGWATRDPRRPRTPGTRPRSGECTASRGSVTAASSTTASDGPPHRICCRRCRTSASATSRNTSCRPSWAREPAVHQAALGCRYHCTFCGVVSVFNGTTLLEGPERLRHHLGVLRDRHGATAVQFYDTTTSSTPRRHSVPALEVLAEAGLPYWCYSRADTLAGFSSRTWAARPAQRAEDDYIAPRPRATPRCARCARAAVSNTRMEAVARCRRARVVPSCRSCSAAPTIPKGDVERTLELVRLVKRRHPAAEIVLYFYSPTPQRNREAFRRRSRRLHLPEQVMYGPGGRRCRHAGGVDRAALGGLRLSRRRTLAHAARTSARQGLRAVLACRFPTVQDVGMPAWGRAVLRELARWRYATKCYGRPVELDLARRLIPLRTPQEEGL